MTSLDSRRNLLGLESLLADDIRSILKTAKKISEIPSNQIQPILKEHTIVNLFFEDSTRTRTSFELAARRLGATVIQFSQSGSSVSKGETILDTAKNIEAMKPSALVIRHSSSGIPLLVSKRITVPVINAGDGFHEHPTQALLDIFTIEQKLGDISGKKILIVGDIAHSRVARSNIHAMRKLGAKVSVSGPPTLLPPDLESMGVEHSNRVEPLLKDADVVMALRVQFERHNQYQIPSRQEYAKYWGINSARAELLKPSAIILHPGPINLGVEVDPEVTEGARSVILEQVTNGVVVRMAVLSRSCGVEGKW